MTIQYVPPPVFYLSYKDGKWIVERGIPSTRIEADTPEEALMKAMKDKIQYLKETKSGKMGIYIFWCDEIRPITEE